MTLVVGKKMTLEVLKIKHDGDWYTFYCFEFLLMKIPNIYVILLACDCSRTQNTPLAIFMAVVTYSFIYFNLPLIHFNWYVRLG